MAQHLAEDIRKIINKLDEYITAIGEAEKDEKADEPEQDDKDPDQQDTDDQEDQDIDDVLTEPKAFERIVGSINIPGMIKMLDIPPEYQTSFKMGINTMRTDDPHPNHEQALALAVGFNRVLSMDIRGDRQLSTAMNTVSGKTMDEDADIAGILNKAGIKPKPGTTTQQHGEDVIKAIGALKKDPNAKKELGLNETQGMEVDVITYNSGRGERLEVVAKDPKRSKKVQGSLQMNPSTMAPQLKFVMAGDTHPYYADWHPQHGWVADFD